MGTFKWEIEIPPTEQAYLSHVPLRMGNMVQWHIGIHLPCAPHCKQPTIEELNTSDNLKSQLS